MKTYRITFQSQNNNYIETEIIKSVNLYQAIRSINVQHSANVKVNKTEVKTGKEFLTIFGFEDYETECDSCGEIVHKHEIEDNDGVCRQCYCEYQHSLYADGQPCDKDAVNEIL